MTYYDRLAKLLEELEEERSAPAKRIRAQLRFASYLSQARGGEFEDRIAQALSILEKDLEKNGALTARGSKEAEKALLPLSAAAKSYRVHLVAHAHIDMNWLWGYEETAAVTVNTFRTMLDLMKRYPAFTFSQSQASTYEIVERFAPEMLPEIAARIAEGRWELSGSTWVENDENMPCAESLARHILYTGKYYKKLFGENTPYVKLDFQPDTFGHAASIPGICRAGGVRWLYHCRGNDGGESLYRWRGEGGAELLCWCDPFWYGGGAYDVGQLDRVPGICEKYGVKNYLSVYGVGDHGGGPTAADVETLLELQSYPVMPTLCFSSYEAFFTAIEEEKADLPVRTGECNFVFSGCYTSQSETKARHRIGEARLLSAEALSAMSGVWADAPSDAEIFEQAWKKLLFTEFHDILPGSGVRATGEYASGVCQEVSAAAGTRAGAAMRAIAERIALPRDPEDRPLGGGAGFASSLTGGAPFAVQSSSGGKKRAFHLFCDLPDGYEGVYELTVWDWAYDGTRAVFYSDRGERLTSVFLAGDRGYWGHEYKTFLIEVSVPGLGYTTVFLDEADRTANPGLSFFENRVLVFPGKTVKLENDLVCAEFDRASGRLRSFTDKQSGEELLPAGGGYFNFVLEDARAGMTAWKEGFPIKKTVLNDASTVLCAGGEHSALRSSFSYSLSFGNGSSLRANVSLCKGEKLLRYDVSTDFYERGGKDGIPRLEVVFPFTGRAEGCRYGAPLVSVDRPQLPHDVPAFFASPVTDKGAPILLTSGTKYGFKCFENRLSLTLLRASADPDGLPEYGAHRFSFAVGAVSDRGEKELRRVSERFSRLPSVCPARAGKGDLPTSASLAKIEGAEIISVKRAENGRGLIFRLTNGESGKKAALTFCRKIGKARLLDLHEEPTAELRPSGSTVRAEVGKGTLVTLYIE